MTAQEIIELVEIGLKNNPDAKLISMNLETYRILKQQNLIEINHRLQREEIKGLPIKIVPILPNGKVIVG